MENKKRKKRTLLENLISKQKKAEKVKEEKYRIEQEEAKIRQEQAEFLKSIYDVVFKSLNIDIEDIVMSSSSEEEIIEKVKAKLMEENKN
jgi:hypothetical protein